MELLWVFVEGGDCGPGEENIVAEFDVGLFGQHSLLYCELLQYNMQRGGNFLF